ncbi:MAG: YbaK/EbsC family protein [Shimia sp.]
MSKSLKRVKAALAALGIDTPIRELGSARTAAEAAASLGVLPAQIANSLIFRGTESGRALLFLTSGGERLDSAKAAAVAGERLEKADAALIRAETGFAIGGVSPVGHVTPTPAWWDPSLDRFDIVYAAAGTPKHVFGLPPARMREIANAQPSDFIEGRK